MKTRLYITTLFCAILALGFFQGCAVDPLETPTPSGPPKKGENGYSACQDDTLVDTDKDGLNDECEKALEIDQPTDPDCNHNGTPDGMELLGPGCTPLPEDPPCPPAGSNLSCEEYQNELDGLKNKDLNKISDGALLASSGLSANAPNGTKVEVQEQKIIIVYNRTAPNSGMPTSGTSPSITEICSEKNGALLDSFIFYRIEGDVMFCSQEPGSTSQLCESKGAKTHAVMILCGKLDLNTNDPAPQFTQSNFKWSKGWVKNEKYTGFFNPEIFNSKNVSSTDVKLTLTPSSKTMNVYKKLDVKFESVFRISGVLYDSSTPSGDGMTVDTTQPIVTLRKFTRTGTIDANTSNTTPFIVGPWHATN